MWAALCVVVCLEEHSLQLPLSCMNFCTQSTVLRTIAPTRLCMTTCKALAVLFTYFKLDPPQMILCLSSSALFPSVSKAQGRQRSC
jgi:hypothetical protein